ncbi:putative nuclease HARBI1 [Dreissena polymorpha]|uniref:putative nuclease HARBI1 n=1 Tax=Dreissena polymorpha TaxID=45954 RepID=UPI002263D15B|nr:putative nuclease HARBI1 [Dreissena polymorpha]
MADIERRLRRARYLNELFPMDRRVFRDRTNPLETLSPMEIRERYRFFPETILFLVNMLNLERATERSCPLPPLISTLAALHFLATGTHHIVTAGLHGISRSRTVQKQFYNIAGFPQVVGVVDGTHIRIQAPSANEDDYMNRKGFHSLNVQMICDATFRFVDVVAKWPGSVHDSRIFHESAIRQRFERGEIDGLLLGDSGYGCKRYLMTPYQNTDSPCKERFNISLCRTRVVIEQAFGVLKRRFPCLHYGLRVKPDRAAKITVACVILHNIGLERQDMFSRTCEDDTDQPHVVYEGDGSGNSYRDHIAESFF